MAEDEKRRQPRIQVQIPVTLLESGGDRVLRATDVSVRGFFIKTDAPKPIRRLVRMRVPVGDEELQILGMVVHRIIPWTARQRNVPPGMGVQLYGLGPIAKEKWSAWVQELIARYPAPQGGEQYGGALPGIQPPPPPVLRRPGSSTEPVDAIRRLHKRYRMAWQARILRGDVAEETHTLNISLGGAFLLSQQSFQMGERFPISLIHPTDGEEFHLDGEVLRVIGPPSPQAGVALQFHTDEQERLDKFIQDGIPEEEEDDALTLLEEDDPMLE